MRTDSRLTLASAVAVLLASWALTSVYEDLGWALRSLGAVLVVALAAHGSRLAGLPRALSPLAGLVGLLLYLAFAFAQPTLLGGLLPGADTAASLAELTRAAFADVEELAPPVPSTPGLVLLAAAGVGAVTLAVDTLTVVLRRAAVAGLPLLLLFVVPSSVQRGGTGVLPFLLGAVGWLALLMADAGERIAGWGAPTGARPQRPVGDASLGRVGRRIGAAALGVAVIVPLLVPGLDNRLLGGDGSGFGGSRKSVVYNPLTRLSGQLSQAEVDLMTYRSPNPDGEYLRLTTLDVFTPDSGWSSSDLAGKVSEDRLEQGIPAPTGLKDTGRTRPVEIDLTGPLDGTWLPLPFPVESVDLGGPWIWDAEADTAFAVPQRARLSDIDEPYTARVTVVDPDVALLRGPQSVPPEIDEEYGQVPQLTVPVRQVLERVTASGTTDFDKVAALQDYFAGEGTEFRYTLETDEPTSETPDPLQFFLETKRGFCEQYASAMAAMVRGLGIPARVAVGFTTGSQTRGDERLVTTKDAHAWPEVWFSGAGWVRFEPTPRTDQRLSTPDYTTAEQREAEPEASATASPSPLPSVAPESAEQQAARERAAEDGLQVTGDGASTGGPPRWLLALSAALLLLGAPSALWALRRRPRLATGSPLDAWELVQEDARDIGHRWRPADSPRSASAHLLAGRRLEPHAAAALARLTAAVEAARYARPQAPVSSAGLEGAALRSGGSSGGAGASGDAAALQHDVQTVRAGLLASVSPLERWRARLLPASTLSWAARSLSDAGADVSDRLDGAVSWVGRAVRRA